MNGWIKEVTWLDQGGEWLDHGGDMVGSRR